MIFKVFTCHSRIKISSANSSRFTFHLKLEDTELIISLTALTWSVGDLNCNHNLVPEIQSSQHLELQNHLGLTQHVAKHHVAIHLHTPTSSGLREGAGNKHISWVEIKTIHWDRKWNRKENAMVTIYIYVYPQCNYSPLVDQCPSNSTSAH